MSKVENNEEPEPEAGEIIEGHGQEISNEVEEICKPQMQSGGGDGEGGGGGGDGNFLLVTGFTVDTSANDLKVFFKQFGKIGRIKIMTSVNATSECQRFAHVSVPSLDGLMKLAETVNGKELKGNKLEVSKVPEDGMLSRKYVLSNLAVAATPAKNENDSVAVVQKAEADGVPKLASTERSDHVTVNEPKRNETAKVQPQPDSTAESSKINMKHSTDNKSQRSRSPRVLSGSSMESKTSYQQRRARRQRENRRNRRSSSSSRRSNLERHERSSSSEISNYSRRYRGRDNYSFRSSSINRRSRESSRERKRARWAASPSPPAHRRYENGSGDSSQDSKGRVPTQRYELNSTGLRLRRRSQTPPLRENRILSYDEIKEAQRERRERRFFEQERRRENEEKAAAEIEEQRQREYEIDREIKFLAEEKERLRLEREEVEREKLELLQLERERQQMEREKIDRDREAVRRAKLRMQEEQQPASNNAHYRQVSYASNADKSSNTSKFGKTIAEMVMEEERQRSRNVKDGSETSGISVAAKTSKRNAEILDHDQLPIKSSFPNNVRVVPTSRIIDRDRHREELGRGRDLRGAIEQRRRTNYLQRTDDHHRGGDASNEVVASPVQSRPLNSNYVHVQKKPNGGRGEGEDLGKVGMWDKPGTIKAGRTDQWIRGINGDGDATSTLKTSISSMIHPTHPQMHFYSYSGYPGYVVPGNGASGQINGVGASIPNFYAGGINAHVEGLNNYYKFGNFHQS